MFNTIRSFADEYLRKFSRRELFQRATAISVPGFLGGAAAAQSSSTGLRTAADIYESIGVKPVINCRGTFTIVGGSLILPEVRAAMDAASRRFVHIDEMMEGIGKRLAELTGAEWGIVTSGCAAALAHATTACVAGGNPDLHVRVPDLAGFAKDEVIIPTHSRNVYDAAIRSVGVRIIEVGTPQELENALGPRAAMVYIFAGPRADSGPLPFETITRIAKQRNVPVLVDAAAERLTVAKRASAARRDARWLQRWQGASGSTERGHAAWTQRSCKGRVGPQRAASRSWKIHEVRQRRSHGHVDGC